MDHNYITFKTIILSTNLKTNFKNYIEGKPKMIEIVNYGCHSTNNISKKLVYVNLGNFLPGFNDLVCHVMSDNNFLTHCGLKFTNNISNFNGSFDLKVYDIDTDLELDDIIFVLNLNLYY